MFWNGSTVRNPMLQNLSRLWFCGRETLYGWLASDSVCGDSGCFKRGMINGWSRLEIMLHVSGEINSRTTGQMNENNDPQKTLHYCKTRIRKRPSSPLQRLPAPASTAANDTHNQSKRYSIDQIKEEQTQASQDSNIFFLRVSPTGSHSIHISCGIQSGTLFQHIFRHIFWYSITWHIFWHSIWHIFWDAIWHFIWHSRWHFV